MSTVDATGAMPTREAWLAEAARKALGGGRRLVGVERVTGGTTKGVFRLTMDDGMIAIAFVWEDAENYWPDSSHAHDPADPFSGEASPTFFEASHRRLRAIGVPVMEIYLVDRTRAGYAADLAIVEDLPGEHLEQVILRSREDAAPLLARLAETLEVMRAVRSPAFGKVAVVDAGGTPPGSCEGAVLTRALRDLGEAAGRDQRIAGARGLLEERLLSLRERVRPRAEYGVVHGELGMDHVRINRNGVPVIIDIEGLMYFDVEWEHVFLRIRTYDEDYRRLAVDGLDEDRLALYMLAQRLSLTAGPLRLLDGPFPDRAFMLGIVEHNLNQALEIVGAVPRN
jgi:hypothetical protein